MSETLAIPIPDAREGSGDPWIDQQFAELTAGLEGVPLEVPFGAAAMQSLGFDISNARHNKLSTGAIVTKWSVSENGRSIVDATRFTDID